MNPKTIHTSLRVLLLATVSLISGHAIASPAGPADDASVQHHDHWICNSGYRPEAGRCRKYTAPENASVIGLNWVCNSGYVQTGDQCAKIVLPENASLTFWLH